MKYIFFVVFLATIVVLSNLVVAQFPFGNYPGWNVDVSYIASILGISDSTWLTLPKFIYNLLIPFIAIWAIVLGMMRAIGIFRNQSGLETIIAFTISFATLPSGVFVSIVSVMLGLLGIYAVGAFFVLFIVGVWLFSGVMIGGWRSASQVDKYSKELDKLFKEREKLLLKEQKTSNDRKRNAIHSRLESLEERIEHAKGKKNRAEAEYSYMRGEG